MTWWEIFQFVVGSLAALVIIYVGFRHAQAAAEDRRAREIERRLRYRDWSHLKEPKDEEDNP